LDHANSILNYLDRDPLSDSQYTPHPWSIFNPALPVLTTRTSPSLPLSTPPTLSPPFPYTPQQVAEFLHRVVQISLQTQKEAGTKLLKDFVKTYESGSGEAPKLIEELKKDVMKFATSFPLPGIPDTVCSSVFGLMILALSKLRLFELS
jgi:hypothetical protein